MCIRDRTEIGTPEALAVRGQAGVANARLAYQAFEEVFQTPRWQSLADDGARPQRPLWASTGVKDPAYPDTMYVTELVAPGTVNTMPEKTLDAVADHGQVRGDTITGTYDRAGADLDDLERIGISYQEVVQVLEKEGLEKFDVSWGAVSYTHLDVYKRQPTSWPAPPPTAGRTSSSWRRVRRCSTPSRRTSSWSPRA